MVLLTTIERQDRYFTFLAAIEQLKLFVLRPKVCMLNAPPPHPEIKYRGFFSLISNCVSLCLLNVYVC